MRSPILHKIAFLSLGLLWLGWIIFPVAALSEDDKKLFPVCQGGKFGFIDRSGKVVIQSQFNSATDFFEKRAQIRVGNLYGFIDENGKVVILGSEEFRRRPGTGGDG